MNGITGSRIQRIATIALAIAAIGLATGAKAEYRCDAPSAPGEKKACELAKLDQPDPLRSYIHRTRATFGLYLPDYVSEQDVQRWEAARQAPQPQVDSTEKDNKIVKSASR